MKKHRFKRAFTKAAGILLVVIMVISLCSSAVLADEMTATDLMAVLDVDAVENDILPTEEVVFEDVAEGELMTMEAVENETDPVPETMETMAESDVQPEPENETETEVESSAAVETPSESFFEDGTELQTDTEESETDSIAETPTDVNVPTEEPVTNSPVTENPLAENPSAENPAVENQNQDNLESEPQSEAETDPQTDEEETTIEQEKEMESETKESETTIEPEPETEPEQEEPKDKDPYGFENFDASLLAGLDFSSMRLIVATSNPDIFVENESVIASYGLVYLLQFEDIETTMKAYVYYYDKADIVDIDMGIQICEGEAAEDVSTGTVMTEEENPFTELEESVTVGGRISYDIALIDTGANGPNITGAVSMIGDNATDDNGHGTKMAQYITAENSTVSILSIKALGSNGKGDISAVLAAIEYAVSQNVKVISLSASAYATSDNQILKEAVNQAKAAGITFVGSAGNNGKNAAYYVPGNIESAFIIGAADEAGMRLDISNFGGTVDYNVVASSTSEAAARMAGWLTVHDMNDIAEILNDRFVYETGYVPTEGEDDPEEEDDSFLTDITWPTQYSNPIAGVTLNTYIEWSGMDAWWPDSNGFITRSAAWEAVGEVSEISQLKPGDVAVWAEGSTANWVNHIAIITEVAADGSYFVSAEGNCANETGLALTTRTDFYKRNSEYGKLLVWRNTVNGASIAKYVDLFTRYMIANNDNSMAVQWSNINWCYCFVVAALLAVEPVEEYGSLTITKNISIPNGSIKVSKTTTGSESDKNVEFTYTLYVSNYSGNVVSTSFDYEKSDGTTGTVSGNGGTFKLKDGQNVVIYGVPQGYGYAVTETANASYTTTVSKNGGEASAGYTVYGYIPAPSVNQEFTFTVNIRNGDQNVSGLEVAEGLTTNSSGNVTFTLTPGISGSASKTLSNIPAGYTYVVYETATSGWTTSPEDRICYGTIAANSTQTATYTNTFTADQQTAAFTNTRKTTSVEVIKTTSASESVIKELYGNAMYSQDFSGAEFDVWVYDANTETWGEKKTYTTGTDGSFSISELYVGDQIYIQETKAPAGYAVPSSAVQQITLAEGTNKVTFKDAPVFASGLPEMKKALYDGNAIKNDIPVSGAIFRMDYYDNTSCSGTAVRTWYLKTDSSGLLKYDAAYLVSDYASSDFYTDENGNKVLPLGSIKMSEIKAPAGYRIYQGTLEGKITQDSSGNASFVWNNLSGGQIGITTDQKLILGDEELVVAIDKVDAGSGRHLKGATLQILDESAVVYEWTTDGTVREIKNTILPGKTYALHEKVAPEDYRLAADIKFQVDQDGNITVLTDNVDTYVTGNGYLAIKMEDVKMVVLPVTGSTGTTWLILIGALLAAASAGTVVYLGRKKRKGGNGSSMNRMKKTVSILACIVTAVMLAVPAFASGTMEVVSEVEDVRTYQVYQLLSGTNLGEDILWDIHIAEDIPDTLWDELGVDKHERAANDIAHFLAQSIDEDTDGSFSVKVAKAVLAENFIQIDAKFLSGEEITLEDGYYLVTSDDAQPMLVLIGNGEKLTINEKSSVPKMEKEIGEVSIDDVIVYGDAADTGIGKVVPYHIIGTLPSNYNVYEEYSYGFHDVYDPCLVVDPDSIKVTIENADGETVSDITKYADIKISDTTMDVTFDNLKQAYITYSEGDVAVVYYEVMITDNAYIGSKSNDNYAWIEYTRSPTCDQLGKSEPDRCRLYTWELDLNKLASDTRKALRGAQFTIHDAKGRFVNTDGTMTTGMTETSIWTTDENGHFAVPEVDSGDFTLTEIQAPEGYQKVSSFNIRIEADYQDENNVMMTASSTGNLVEIESVDAKGGITYVRACDLPDNPPPQTGDNTHLILYAIFMLMGLIGIGTVLMVMVRNKMKTRE